MSVLSFASHLFDPRGRCDRKGLLIVASLLLTVEALLGLALWLDGSDFGGAGVLVLKLIFGWLAITASSKRLHDFNLSAWRLAWAFLALIAWSVLAAVCFWIVAGDTALEQGSLPYNFLLATTVAPTVLGALWLHLARGDEGSNRFGAIPGPFGFAPPPRSGHDWASSPIRTAVGTATTITSPATELA